MHFTANMKLGPYEIGPALGAGGMGEVYRARDMRLGRDVALKILPESFARDPSRVARFEREARAIAALSHPNILAIFDVGQDHDTRYLVSELLEGETLRDRLRQAAISPRKAVEYASQIARGLSAAHERGIVHRDLKPENIFVTRDGLVKILDFGLAKQSITNEAPNHASATMARSDTEPGMMLGTVSYMAPEQVRGRVTDHRADIFSFGAVLYEMLTGSRAFSGESSVETMNAILTADPPEIESGGTKISPGLDRIVRHCLEKDPADRFQSARDLAFALSALSGSEASLRAPAISPKRYIAWYWWAAAGLALVAFAALLMSPIKSRTPHLPSMHFAIPVRGEITYLAISPDGRMLAFVSPDETSDVPTLFLQPVGGDTPIEVAGSENAMYPFWSPDGTQVAYFAHGKLMKANANGTEQHTLAPIAEARGGTWGRRNVIIYSPDAGGPLWRINADGTGAAPLTQKLLARTESSHRWPQFLPDGNRFLFWAGSFGKDTNKGGTFLSSLDKQEKKLVVRDHSNTGFAEPNSLFYINTNNELVTQAFDYKTGEVTGEPHVAAHAVGYQSVVYWAAFTVSENGTLVLNAKPGGPQSVMTWLDRAGKQLATVADTGTFSNPALSPFGNAVAYDRWNATSRSTSDIWTSNLLRNTAARFTFEPGEATTPIWSPDAKYIVFRFEGDYSLIMMKLASGLESPKIIARTRIEDDLVPSSWSPDGRYVLCVLERGGTGTNLVLIKIGDPHPIPFLTGASNQLNGQISPDGKWVAYSSDESGDSEIYVTSFPSAAGKWQISRGGGREPRWRGDGEELFFIGEKDMLMSAVINAERMFSAGTPQPLFQIRSRAPVSNSDLFSYDVDKNGKRFLVNRYVKPAYVPPLEITLNVAGASPR